MALFGSVLSLPTNEFFRQVAAYIANNVIHLFEQIGVVCAHVPRLVYDIY